MGFQVHLSGMVTILVELSLVSNFLEKALTPSLSRDPGQCCTAILPAAQAWLVFLNSGRVLLRAVLPPCPTPYLSSLCPLMRPGPCSTNSQFTGSFVFHPLIPPSRSTTFLSFLLNLSQTSSVLIIHFNGNKGNWHKK